MPIPSVSSINSKTRSRKEYSRLSEVLAISDVVHVLKDGRLVATVEPRSVTESTLHSLMVGRERDSDYYHESRQFHGGENPVRLEVRGLSRTGKYHDISVKVKAGEIVGIGVLVASGKSALGKGIGYVPAERLTEGLIARFRLSWNISLAGGHDMFASGFGRWLDGKERGGGV